MILAYFTTQLERNLQEVECHYCGTEKETRPYGPGGSGICFSCMKESPEREQAAKNTFGTLLDANASIGTGAVVLTESGPQPFYIGD